MGLGWGAVGLAVGYGWGTSGTRQITTADERRALRSRPLTREQSAAPRVRAHIQVEQTNWGSKEESDEAYGSTVVEGLGDRMDRVPRGNYWDRQGNTIRYVELLVFK